MVGPILLGICILLFACLMITNRIRFEGFTENECASLHTKEACVNAACTWNKASKKCVGCSTLRTCEACVNNNSCGWCLDGNKCVNSDRMGFPSKRECSDSDYVIFMEKCPHTIPTPIQQYFKYLYGSY